ncbi:hypothetical protein VTJ83DRAFT_6520 [Remersonia thermophila]|uniref:Uncharacterized protein n=1 Tax=Remersonia thermophila TaxID=72144 RepID=A0ABR4D4Y0_9PEZI
MSFDWEPQYCLGCDRQTDGATYCTEACRLADYERSSTPSSAASSPALTTPLDWTAMPSRTMTSSPKSYLSPAYDFSLNSSQPSLRRSSTQSLSPSPSFTSLCSMRSTTSTSTADATQLTEKAARELRAYARSFESVRNQRRRSA